VTDHATSRIPIATSTDGHAYIGVDAAVALLRAIAETCRNLADDPEAGDLRIAAQAIDLEADNLDCRGIEHTR
jgi:plasmid stabilization system protein ParE